MNICIEGPDGSGKTTIAKMVAETLGVEYVRCPGSTGIGELLRPVLKNMSLDVNPVVRCLLFAAVDFDACSRHSSSVFDRTGLSGIIYRTASERYTEMSLLMDIISYDSLFIMPSPARLYVLDADDGTLDARMNIRQDDNDEGTLLRTNVREIYRGIPGLLCVKINTSNMSIDECVKYIIDDSRSTLRGHTDGIYNWCMATDWSKTLDH